jgi:hypothetical protein
MGHRSRGPHLPPREAAGELSVTCAPDSDAGAEAPLGGNPSSEQPLNFVAPASGNIKPQPRIVTLYRLRLRQATRERQIRSQTDDLPKRWKSR